MLFRANKFAVDSEGNPVVRNGRIVTGGSVKVVSPDGSAIPLACGADTDEGWLEMHERGAGIGAFDKHEPCQSKRVYVDYDLVCRRSGEVIARVRQG